MLLWLVLEFALRRGLGPRLAEPLGTGLGADAAVMLVGLPLIAAAIARWGIRGGVGPADWDYDFSLRAVAAGVVGCLGVLALNGAIAFVYTTVFGLEPSLDAAALGVGAAPAWALGLLLLVNGVLAPITEELAWRGVIQTALAESYGTYAAVVVTAVAFVLKHLVVDMAAPLFRVTSLVLLAFLFCALRARYGTASSTAAHLTANLLLTALLVTA